MEQIGKKLQEQYETLSLRTRYKQYLDPSVDETKKFCISLRRNAKDERVLFHYNGHGVPLPTPSGEIWVFNKTYTQYIPVSLYDLQSWLAGPSLFVFDVSHAGHIVSNFHKFVEKHEKENVEARRKDANAPIQNYKSLAMWRPPDEIKVPGRLQDRRSPLGELNWIFTAITDTIAWNTLPRALFKKLFRQDLMVAALFRNFLLSERIMRTHECRPISSPELPETHTHPLWQSWDLAVEMVLSQLPALLEHEEGKRHYEYQHSSFFSEQLTAFEVYLSSGPTESNPPDQLPIVLQVLLSQAHRLRALILLSKFLDLGPWAVHLALSIGIFPYVVKLLQSAAQELKPVMVFIWARIMAVDHTVQNDLLKDNGIHYFITILNPSIGIPVGNEYPQGQNVCLSPELIEFCLHHLMDVENPLLRQWCCLCISMLWNNFAEAKWMGIRCSAPARLCELTMDPVPEVRAAMLHALTSFIGIPDLTDQVAQVEEYLATAIVPMGNDGSALVRETSGLLIHFCEKISDSL
ncbi:WD repeat-containing protein mip1 [Coccidioides immitis H538.4]|uniref:WD repeat-containing protein mip1 n=1 Tax=Coccidioides immitis H538.4 TaxID=396776 RepID=A0A0J8RVQ3_COCIT|nr:WD repeat-containing protein mip1 [Coccidioides immitis H538.4]